MSKMYYKYKTVADKDDLKDNWKHLNVTLVPLLFGKFKLHFPQTRGNLTKDLKVILLFIFEVVHNVKMLNQMERFMQGRDFALKPF